MKASRFLASPLLLPLLLSSLAGASSPNEEDVPPVVGVVGCEVKIAHPATKAIPPTWQASFPGSGSRMTRYLMEALTGTKAHNLDVFARSLGGWGRRGDERSRVVAVKTHYPSKNKDGFEAVDHLFDRAMVIFRNPLHAFPSLFNQRYEAMHDLSTHSVRGPQEDWITWRERGGGIREQIARFEYFVNYWMEKYPRDERPERLLLLSYEELTDPWLGPYATGRMAEFLGRVEGVDVVRPEEVACVWDAVVNFKKRAMAAAAATATAAADGTVPEDDDDDDVEVEVEEVPEDGGGGRRRRLGAAPPSDEPAAPSEPAVAVVDPGSLRSGPKVRPYAFEDLEEMAAALRRLLERHGNDDEFFARTFSSYLEVVRNTVIEEGRAIRWEG